METIIKTSFSIILILFLPFVNCQIIKPIIIINPKRDIRIIGFNSEYNSETIKTLKPKVINESAKSIYLYWDNPNAEIIKYNEELNKWEYGILPGVCGTSTDEKPIEVKPG